ncbi:hypothetical protein HRI96_04045 [Treponema parvum]|uniref:Uncharacterized protein n=1 Tax=Treponema parvum TaxID=138851 RepID=A0A975EYU4_9SPIR|nr:hypothetical protein [Treponema parvum]QTQ11441.1 hypothetical protein HRI96_04045 [Treponema parvum]
MFLFLLLFFPFVLVAASVIKGSFKEYFVPAVLGAFAGIFTCLIYTFFIFPSSSFSFGFASNFARILFKNIFLPMFLSGAALFLLLKDPFETRIKVLFPYWIVFYALFIPCTTISGKTDFSFFELFLRPVLYVSMLVMFDGVWDFFLLKRIKAEDKTAASDYGARDEVFGIDRHRSGSVKSIIMLCLALFFVLSFPAAVETLRFIGAPRPVWILMFVVYAAAAVYVAYKIQTHFRREK